MKNTNRNNDISEITGKYILNFIIKKEILNIRPNYCFSSLNIKIKNRP